jgi:protein subunit release factor A
MEKLILEIHAGEGGKDSQLFIKDMSKMYSAYCKKIGATWECL